MDKNGNKPAPHSKDEKEISISGHKTIQPMSRSEMSFYVDSMPKDVSPEEEPAQPAPDDDLAMPDPLDLPPSEPPAAPVANVANPNVPVLGYGVDDDQPLAKRDLPRAAYFGIAICMPFVILPIVSGIAGGARPITFAFVLSLDLVIVTVIKLIFAIKAKKDAWRYYVAVLVLVVAALGVTGFFEGRRQYVNSFISGHGCTLSGGYTDFENDVPYVECIASSITREVVGRNMAVTAQCALDHDRTYISISSGHWSGWVRRGDAFSSLDRPTCEAIYNWLKTDRTRINNLQGWALHVAIHEAIHLTGEYDEAKTELKTYKSYVQILEKFGVKRSEAERYNEYFKTEVNPRQPSKYRLDWDKEL